jgi:predicted nucleotidyltransferase component of viral defense system
MLIVKPEDTLHKAWMCRVLAALVDDPVLMHHLRFKGGTCAAMRGFLNRFSVDLDFDVLGALRLLPGFRKRCAAVFHEAGLTIHTASVNTLQYFLKYPAEPRQRATLKIDALIPPPKANRYEPVYFPDVDRVVWCQTRATMVANKLVAPLDRFAQRGGVAGRDIYDIHVFLSRGFAYAAPVIRERRKQTLPAFFADLIAFVAAHVTARTIDQDLNVLLPLDEFRRIRTRLKDETLMLLRTEAARVAQA